MLLTPGVHVGEVPFNFLSFSSFLGGGLERNNM